jgi:hypothetical protein
MHHFEELIGRLDATLFDAVYSQLYDADKKTLLAIQKTIRENLGTYSYLEIGSYMGGSIQPHLLDPRCTRIYSIDKRPFIPPDDRGIVQKYPDNSTAKMLALLRELSPEGVKKVTCFDGDASDTDTVLIAERPNLCFIDGEHTEKAVLSDFQFCRKVLAEKGLIYFHDSHVVFTGLAKVVESLKADGAVFRAYALPQNVFVVELGAFSIHQSPAIVPTLINNYEAYLAGLTSMEHYRDVYNSLPVKVIRFFHRRLLDLRHPSRIRHYGKH